MDPDEFVWMHSVLAAWRKDQHLWKAVGTYMRYSGAKTWDEACNEISKLKSASPYLYRSLTARVWLADYFRPVSDALWAGATDEQAIKLWRSTRARRSTRVNRGKSSAKYYALRLQGNALAREEYAHGWRAKHDWKVVK